MTCWQAISEILKAKSTERTRLGKLLHKNFPQYKENSAAPALSALIRVGCVEVRTIKGTERCFFLKPFTNVEHARLKKYINGKRNLEGKIEKQMGLCIRGETVSISEARSAWQELNKIFSR